VDDWLQNFLLGTEQVCKEGNPNGGVAAREEQVCCHTRTGFYQAYNAAYKNDMEASLRKCANDCSNPDECVVLVGYSQGAAIAAVAALYLSDLNPFVITFGQPATIDQPCPLITSERYYRYVNSKDSVEGRLSGISYDPVPFLPGLGTDSFGHMIILSSDHTGVAYMGLDTQERLGPLDITADAHAMENLDDSPPSGYLDRINAITYEGIFRRQ
jgi:pimeloyl-ACP methyl ester carboxylesterase